MDLYRCDPSRQEIDLDQRGIVDKGIKLMANNFVEWISRLVTAWKFWLIVSPWEIGIRVRIGRTAIELLPGPHWRIPFLDQVLIVNTRLRIASTPTVSLNSETNDNKVNCRKAIIGYRISDPLVAVQAFEAPSVAVTGHVQASIASSLPSTEILDKLRIEFKDKGIEIVFLKFSEDVEAQAIRLLQADWTIASEHFSSQAGVY